MTITWYVIRFSHLTLVIFCCNNQHDEIKIFDLGLSGPIPSFFEVHHLSMAGSYRYMAPEIAAENHTIHAVTCIHSLCSHGKWWHSTVHTRMRCVPKPSSSTFLKSKKGPSCQRSGPKICETCSLWDGFMIRFNDPKCRLFDPVFRPSWWESTTALNRT